MTFDPTQPFQCIDGVFVNLTSEQIADNDAVIVATAAVVAANPPIPDLATQLAAALINNGTLQPTDINATTLTAVNATLQASGQTAISTNLSVKLP